MRQVAARYEKGVLRLEEPLPLRSGESVKLIVVRRADPRRWDMERLKSPNDEEVALAEQGIEDWAANLEEEDRR